MMNLLVKFFTAIFEAAIHVFLSMDPDKIYNLRKNYTHWYIAGKQERKIRREFRRNERIARRQQRKIKRQERRLTRRNRWEKILEKIRGNK